MATSNKQKQGDTWQEKYQEYLLHNGLKSTVQRDLIANEFYRLKGHITAEDLHANIRKKHSSIGLATVYRTLKILASAGIAHERRFNDGFTRYEFFDPEDRHHDHIVCISCGKVEEFENDEIEELQKSVAKRYKFTMLDHKLEIYGRCNNCSTKAKNG